MAKPNIKPTTAGYDLLWLEDQITVEVSRLHTHTDGRVTGEIFIRNGSKAIKPPSQINFVAERTRDSLVKSLTDTFPGKAEWRKIIDELCYYVLELTRQGEPVIEAWSGENVQPPKYLLDPFLIEGYPSIIFGDPGSIKSTLALVLSQVVTFPWVDNPMGLMAPTRPHKVLYLDWETDFATITWQLTMLERGMGLGSCMVHYRRCTLPLANDVAEIKKKIAELNIDLIILDSLGLATGGELKEAAPVLAFFAALRQLATTSLILAHSPKDNENVKNKSIYGSVFFQAQARNIWEIRKSQEQGSDTADIALYHKKPAPFQQYHSPLGFTLKYHDIDKLAISQNDPKSVPDLLERMGTRTRILQYMKEVNETMSAKEIAEGTGVANINKTMTDLKNAGKVVHPERGLWGLADV